MRQETRLQYTALAAALAAAYSVQDVSKHFSATPEMEQTLVDAVMLSNGFLSRVNRPLVVQQSGQAIMLGVSGYITSRTDTTADDRETKDASDLEPVTYDCKKTESDVHITYQQLDAWAKFPDFQARLMAAIQRQIGLDMLQIGFNGTSAATASVDANLLDVNIGWLKKLKDGRPAGYLMEGDTAGQIQIGATGDYKNLDHLVRDVRNLIAEEHADDGDLVAIIGRDLVAHDQGKMYAAAGQTPTEKALLEMAQVIATYGGLPSFTVPKFPAKGLLITSFDNLSVYTQEGSIRRAMIDNPKRDRTEHYFSRNEAYVVEKLGKAAAIEAANVVFV